MRIAIATEKGMVAAHFGRCAEYTLADVEDGCEVARQVVQSPPHEPERMPAFLREHRADAVIAGGMGPRAQRLFDAMGIRQVIGVQGSVDDVVSGCLDGSLSGGESLCTHGSADHEHCGS